MSTPNFSSPSTPRPIKGDGLLNLGIIRSTCSHFNNHQHNNNHHHHTTSAARPLPLPPPMSYYSAQSEVMLANAVAQCLIEHYIAMGRDKYVPACYDFYGDDEGEGGDAAAAANNVVWEKRLVFSPTTPLTASSPFPSSASSASVVSLALQWQAHHHPLIPSPTAVDNSDCTGTPPTPTADFFNDEDAMRRLMDRAMRRVFGILVNILSGAGNNQSQSLLSLPSSSASALKADATTPAFVSRYQAEGVAPSVVRLANTFLLPSSRNRMSLGNAISVATAMFSENGGAKQVLLRDFSCARAKSSSPPSSSINSNRRGAPDSLPNPNVVDCACTITIVTSASVPPPLPTPTTSAPATSSSSAPSPSHAAAVLTEGKNAFIVGALLQQCSAVGAADVLTPEAAQLAEQYSSRWKRSRQLTARYLNSEWLTPMLQSLKDKKEQTGGNNAISAEALYCELFGPIVDDEESNGELGWFSTIRQIIGSALLSTAATNGSNNASTAAVGLKRKKVPVPISIDIVRALAAEAELRRRNGTESDETVMAVGYGEEASEGGADKSRVKGKKSEREASDAGADNGVTLKQRKEEKPQSSSVSISVVHKPVFMAEPTGIVMCYAGATSGAGDEGGDADSPTTTTTTTTPSLPTTYVNVLVVGIDSLYAYLGVELSAMEYHCLRRDEERRKKRRLGGGEAEMSDSDSSDESDSEKVGGHKKGGANSNNKNSRYAESRRKATARTYYEMRAPRTFGVIGRVPLPSSSSSPSAAPTELFANYRTFVSKNRQNKMHHQHAGGGGGGGTDLLAAEDLSPSSAGPIQPPAHVMWISESARPKKPSELLSIKWVDGRDLWGCDVGVGVGSNNNNNQAAAAYRQLVACSLLMFSWVVRAVKGSTRSSLPPPSSSSSSASSSMVTSRRVPFLVPIVEIEEAHVLGLEAGVGAASASAAGAKGHRAAAAACALLPPFATLCDFLSSIEGSAAKLVKRTTRQLQKASSSSSSASSPTATLLSKLEDCGSVYFTDHFLGKHHPLTIAHKAQRRLHQQLVSLLSDRVWHEGKAITEAEIVKKAEALACHHSGLTAMDNAAAAVGSGEISSIPRRLAEGPCIEYKQHVSAYNSSSSSFNAPPPMVDIERLRHTIGAMLSSGLGGVIIVGVRDGDGAVLGHAPGAVKDNLRTTAFFPAQNKDTIRILEVKVRSKDRDGKVNSGKNPSTSSSAAADGAAAAKPAGGALPAGWWKTMTSTATATALANTTLTASGAAKPITASGGSSNSILTSLAAKAIGGSNTNASSKSSQNNNKVVTIVAVEPSPAPFAIAALKAHGRLPKVRGGGASNVTLTVGGVASRLLPFTPTEEHAAE